MHTIWDRQLQKYITGFTSDTSFAEDYLQKKIPCLIHTVQFEKQNN